jgi:osmoprotectant transport system substrate-binding protein
MGGKANLLLAVALLAGCSSKQRVIVGSKNFTEQALLGEIVAQQIEAAGLPVERKPNLGGTLLAHQALLQGGIDLYPEYSGTALTAILKQPVASEPAPVLRRVRDEYARIGLQWLEPLGFDNTFAIVVRSETARRDGLDNISAAARRPRPWRLGVGYEFVQRPDGLDGLMRAYGLRLEDAPVTMDLGLLYPALESGRIAMAAGSATDGRLADGAFTVLQDDRHYFPPYECAIVVRDDAVKRFPGLKPALDRLSGRIPAADMRRMNAAVDRDHRSVADVAREFLAAKGK